MNSREIPCVLVSNVILVTVINVNQLLVRGQPEYNNLAYMIFLGHLPKMQ